MLIRIQIIAQVLKVYHKHTIGLDLCVAWGVLGITLVCAIIIVHLVVRRDRKRKKVQMTNVPPSMYQNLAKASIEFGKNIRSN